MNRLRLAYRDHDRTPVIFCIREMAKRYEVEVEVVRIQGTKEYEDALFDGSCDVIIEHLEYLFAEAAAGKKITMFCAPVRGSDVDLVVPANTQSVEELKGTKIAVRGTGRPHVVNLRIRALGLEGQVTPVIVHDADVGRWRQWKKVTDGECAAAFISCQYLPAALEAGLKVLDSPDVDIVGHYHQACLTEFARANDDLLRRYVSGVIHAICLMKLRPEEAMAVIGDEPWDLIGVADPSERRRLFDCNVSHLQFRPLPTPEGVINSYQVAIKEWPVDGGINPLALWDLHWVKQLDDEGFIDQLMASMSR